MRTRGSSQNQINKKPRLDYPEGIALMLYEDCQLSCKFCYIHGMHIELEPGQLLNFYANIIQSYGCEEHYPVIFIGGLGEPTFGRNYPILEELVKLFPKNKFVLFSNLVEPEKTIMLAKNNQNIEKIVGRIISEHGGDNTVEGITRHPVEEVIKQYEKANILEILEFEILLFPSNVNTGFPIGLLETYSVPYSYAGAVPLGNALETGFYLSKEETIQQSKSKKNPEKFLGSRDCNLIHAGLHLTGLNVSLCPAALIRRVYAKYPEKYASNLIEDREELRELRELNSSLIAKKKGKDVSNTGMCLGREILYSNLR